MASEAGGMGRGAEGGRPRRWTEDEVETLRALARQNTPTRVMGMKLGRSDKSVRGKAAQEGISLKPTSPSS